MPRLPAPPGTPLGFGRLCNFLATIFFLFSPVFYLLPVFLFFGQRPRSQIAAVASQRHKRAAQEKGGEKRVSEMDRVWEKIKSEYVEQVQTIVQAAGWGAVPPVVVLFHSIPFRFISFRFALMASHGIAILIAMQKCVCHFWNWKAAGRRAILPLLYVWAWPALLFASGILLPAFGRELRNCQPHRHIQSERQLPGQK